MAIEAGTGTRPGLIEKEGAAIAGIGANMYGYELAGRN
uniref:Uncharacterized protein n=1 Tax=Amphimedon queenslandica TaxID=400682 RepID=A0A1X7U108_AMPQE